MLNNISSEEIILTSEECEINFTFFYSEQLQQSLALGKNDQGYTLKLRVSDNSWESHLLNSKIIPKGPLCLFEINDIIYGVTSEEEKLYYFNLINNGQLVDKVELIPLATGKENISYTYFGQASTLNNSTWEIPTNRNILKIECEESTLLLDIIEIKELTNFNIEQLGTELTIVDKELKFLTYFYGKSSEDFSDVLIGRRFLYSCKFAVNAWSKLVTDSNIETYNTKPIPITTFHKRRIGIAVTSTSSLTVFLTKDNKHKPNTTLNWEKPGIEISSSKFIEDVSIASYKSKKGVVIQLFYKLKDKEKLIYTTFIV